jgi:hypothetical protein
MKSVMQHNFAKAPQAKIQRSSFDRSYGYKTTFDAGKLIPHMVQEVLPGDTFNVKMTSFARLATPIHPIMDNMKLQTHFFFVPNRLVWDNWNKFMGEQEDPGDSTDYLIPSRTTDITIEEGSMGDYLGLPINKSLKDFSVLPFRGIGLIWNDWFRDQNLQDSVEVDKGDSQAAIPSWNSPFGMLPRGKRRDYLTSALPFPQKGDAVELPLGEKAEVHTGATTGGFISVYSDPVSEYRRIDAASSDAIIDTATGSSANVLYADLSTATAATINNLRQAFAIQKLLERDARGGSRYVEIIKSHFGVTSPDFRLQRSEYLGGGSTDINISPVAQTSSTDATTPQGNLSALGTAAASNHGFTKSFTEHGHIIGFVSVQQDITYQNGIDRMWSRQTRNDFFWPEFVGLGEQEVLNKEIYADGSASDENVFGYQERFAEYKYAQSKITSKMRSGATGSLDSWHLGENFTSLPTLSSTFIEESSQLDRCIAVPTEPHFIFDSYIKMICSRPMPVYSVPGFIDHF